MTKMTTNIEKPLRNQRENQLSMMKLNSAPPGGVWRRVPALGQLVACQQS